MTERRAVAAIAPIMSELLGISAEQVDVGPAAERANYDLKLRADDWKFAVELAPGAPSTYLAKWQKLAASAPAKWVSALVVPYMTAHGRVLCESHGINWIDLSGNVSIRAPGLRLFVMGRENRHAKPGRPSSPFAKRAVRITRALLQEPERAWTIKDCAEASGLDMSQASRTVRRLINDELLVRDDGLVRVPSPQRLLEAWRADADFSKHRVLQGTIAARSGEELAPRLSQRLEELELPAAASGLAAAWQYDHFAAFRLTTFYVANWPSDAQLEALGFRETTSGGNVWLVVPSDDGVFDGASVVDGIRCVHPVQVFVDLKDHPERAREAAEHLESHVLKWTAP
ncbi:MAG: hypothetical protein ACO1OB_34450 [Archangium sp.]